MPCQLRFLGIGILAAQMDDRPAALAKNEQGETLVFVEGLGKHQLTLSMVMPVIIDAAQQTLQLPKAAAQENLSCPFPEISRSSRVLK